MAKNTHTLMPFALAKALMEAGVQHFDAGGEVTWQQGPNKGLMGKIMNEQWAKDQNSKMAAQNQWNSAHANDFAPSMAGAPGGGGSGGPGGVHNFGDSGFFGSLMGQNSFQANMAPTQTSDFSKLINASANQSQDVHGQQQALADALLAQSRGEGPNPAMAALNQQTGQNVANQAALMASQRGSSANPALMARQAAMQGAATQQTAAGQGALMQAQQQLAAQQALSRQQEVMGGQNLGMFQAASGAQNSQNKTGVENYGMAQGINAETSAANAGAGSKVLGGVLGAAGTALGGPLGGAIGGVLGGLFAKGGAVPSHFHHMASIYHKDAMSGPTDFRSGGVVPGVAPVSGDSEKNDIVPALLSPGEQVLPRSVTMAQNAPERAAEFVRHLQEKEAAQTGYKKVAQSKQSLQKRVERLEKLFKGGTV